jgi:hypothetical protein
VLARLSDLSGPVACLAFALGLVTFYLLCTLCLIRSTYLFVVLEQENTMGKVIE